MTSSFTRLDVRPDRSDGPIPDRRWIRIRVATVSFWIAILLPMLSLPLLAVGIDTTDELLSFLGLLGLWVLALVGGRRYPDSVEE